jgi:hypothetical protein
VVQSLGRSFEDLTFFLGAVTEKFYISKIGGPLETPMPISQWWLECADDKFSALAVKSLSLSLSHRLHMYYQVYLSFRMRWYAGEFSGLESTFKLPQTAGSVSLPTESNIEAPHFH